MKKQLLLIIVLFLVKLNAQVVFCPPGAEWRYNFVQYNGYALNNEKITYSGDTTIGGEFVKKLRHKRFFTRNDYEWYTPLTYIKQSGDTVFMKNSRTQNSWQILYNFNCQVGHGWSNTLTDFHPTPVHHYVAVDSITTVVVNGETLKKLYVKYSNDVSGSWGSAVSAEITERFGCNKFMFNFECHLQNGHEDLVTDFLCYKDTTFSQTQFTQKPCDYVDFVGLNESIFDFGSFSVYPNPAAGSINLKLDAPDGKEFKVELSELSGKVLEVFRLSGAEKNLNLENYKAGVYFVSVIYKGRVVEAKKLVVY